MTDTDPDGTITKAVSKALQEDEDLKTWFCECWPCLKRLFQLIAARLPKLKVILELLIKRGDQIHRTICPLAS